MEVPKTCGLASTILVLFHTCLIAADSPPVGEDTHSESVTIPNRSPSTSDPIATSLGLTPETGTLPIWTEPEEDAQQQLGEFVRSANQGVVLVGHPKGGTGTGFVISRKHRLLATNAHVADIAHAYGGEMFASPDGTTSNYRVKQIWYHPGIMRMRAAAGGKFELVQSADPRAGSVYPRCPDVAVLKLADAGPDLPIEFQLSDRREMTQAFAHGIRVDCLWELLAYHRLDDLVTIPVGRSEVNLARFQRTAPRDSIASEEPERLVKEAVKFMEKEQQAIEFFRKERYSEATEKCSQAIRLDPNYAPAYYWRAESIRQEVENFCHRGSDRELNQRFEQAFADYGKTAQIETSSQVFVLTNCLQMLRLWAPVFEAATHETPQSIHRLALGLADRIIPTGERITVQAYQRRDSQLRVPEPLAMVENFRSKGIPFELGEQLIPDEAMAWSDVANLHMLRAEAKYHLGDYRGAVADYEYHSPEAKPHFYETGLWKHWMTKSKYTDPRGFANFYTPPGVAENMADSWKLRALAYLRIGRERQAQEYFREAEGLYWAVEEEWGQRHQQIEYKSDGRFMVPHVVNGPPSEDEQRVRQKIAQLRQP